MRNETSTTAHRVGMLASIAALTLSACGNDANAAVRDGVLAVEMADFHYGELPDEVPAGTKIEVSNSAERELHEFVTYRLADDDDRPADVIISDPASLAAGGPPVAVLLAAPGGEQIAAVGDGTLTEPGRYIIMCAIPTGADPDEYLAAAATSDGPPQVDGGQPHFTNGMVAELTVTG